MKIKLFRNAIAFSFWHFYGKPHGTAIECLKLKPGLFGVKLPRYESTRELYPGIQIGFWWSWELSLIAIHEIHFKDKYEG